VTQTADLVSGGAAEDQVKRHDECRRGSGPPGSFALAMQPPDHGDFNPAPHKLAGQRTAAARLDSESSRWTNIDIHGS
jgi:hypothetical protein